jgi:hypothetical protein
VSEETALAPLAGVKRPRQKVKRTWTLTGLPGVNAKTMEAYPASTVARCLYGLRIGTAVSTASDEGSISAWRDDDGMYRAERDRYRATVAQARFKTRAEVARWWAEQLPLIEREIPGPQAAQDSKVGKS